MIAVASAPEILSRDQIIGGEHIGIRVRLGLHRLGQGEQIAHCHLIERRLVKSHLRAQHRIIVLRRQGRQLRADLEQEFLRRVPRILLLLGVARLGLLRLPLPDRRDPRLFG